MAGTSLFEDLTFGTFFSLTPSRTLERITPPPKHRKRVLFSERVKVVEIPSAKCLTRKDKKALWYSDPSESAGRYSIIQQLLCTVDDNRDDTYEYEGDRGDDQPEERRKLPVSAVLVEQKSQRESGIEDVEFIAKIYKRCSAHAAMKAQIRAMQYEQVAREYVSTDSRVKRKSKQLFRKMLVA
mmetsp:Transcript_18172/g.37461  ORF Transcript_18172/g.37461 Transcript_18172/m.37461 type:complete len:183 (+) Transcript_18172:110-658(+)|eukprot:CAMPEP_0197277124 /NCGR_PEP_ID=MMETSP1432-20130617/16577_1 /TAXON_ID=44447 /ORGANISM="Pseudo-nitzschia delicatissima, Strain UNC1205" /LENGTH=182 /DNA_ID=CAMNT_0042743283 /DNA_START=83 /DNA_END=631 /DNA_ORIENTATION=+